MPSPDPLLTRAKRLDRLMAWTISAGGVLIIAAVLGILVFIAGQSLPLLRPARTTSFTPLSIRPSERLLLDESGRAAFTVDRHRGLEAWDDQGQALNAPGDGPARPWQLLGPMSAKGEIPLLDAQGALSMVRLSWDKPSGENSPQHWTARAEWSPTLQAGRPLQAILHARTLSGGGLEGSETLAVLALGAGELLYGQQEATTIRWTAIPTKGTPTAALLAPDGRSALVGTQEGCIQLWNLGSTPALDGEDVLGHPVATASYVLGQVSILVGTEDGRSFAYQVLRKDGQTVLQRFHTFQPLKGAVRGFMASLRDKRFLVWTDHELAVDHLTTERRLLRATQSGLTAAALSPRGEYIQALDGTGSLRRWHLDAPHPEASWKVLWGKIHYESYDKPEHVWQSTGGSDDFEPKLSLWPLLFGTLKGTLYAMLFALPLAVFGALYTSQFASARLRRAIKPTIEIMAALPSVVLGFLAGLLLAPLFEKGAIQFLLMPACAAFVGLLAIPIWNRLPRAFKSTWGDGREVLWVIPILLLGFGLSLLLGPWFEKVFLLGDFRAWLLSKHALTYDQRNAMVVGFAMGFAVIPIIFTISEDALSSVPKSLTSASLACGASPWQTAWRVVLPTGSPGIFSAIMVGFGRAIGETMIVLMATGNTPVMEWSPFNGMRTLSANIATEAMEAPVHGTLYRVLFLTALLLFALTFVLNTLAEVIRQHLRKRYETF